MSCYIQTPTRHNWNVDGEGDGGVTGGEGREMVYCRAPNGGRARVRYSKSRNHHDITAEGGGGGGGGLELKYDQTTSSSFLSPVLSYRFFLATFFLFLLFSFLQIMCNRE